MSNVQGDIEYFLGEKLSSDKLCEVTNAATVANSLFLTQICFEVFLEYLKRSVHVPKMENLDKNFALRVLSEAMNTNNSLICYNEAHLHRNVFFFSWPILRSTPQLYHSSDDQTLCWLSCLQISFKYLYYFQIFYRSQKNKNPSIQWIQNRTQNWTKIYVITKNKKNKFNNNKKRQKKWFDKKRKTTTTNGWWAASVFQAISVCFRSNILILTTC